MGERESSMLSIKGLSVTVDGKPIINGLNLEVGAGEVHAIMGPNGSGKSTLAYVLAGRPGYTVTAGTVHYLGQDLLALPP
jgi:Fe-S cluster assembly ATP-binding protein